MVITTVTWILVGLLYSDGGLDRELQTIGEYSSQNNCVEAGEALSKGVTQFESPLQHNKFFCVPKK